ncbi:MAG: acyl-CoA dehydrogenase family protein [Myxococcales bacterium]|nr:acyl-CoA dehydrogenase family protein [Myxococcales bacterium]
MLSFELGEDLTQIQATVRDFAQREIRPALRKTERSGASKALAERYEELGLFGLDWPADLGGQGMGALARVIVEEELSLGDVGTAFALDRGGAAAVFLKAAGGERASSALSELLRNKGSAALAMAEDVKAQDDFRTTARKVGGGWELSGKKSFVLNGAEASQYVVLAQVEQGKGLAGAGAFLVQGGSAGLAPGKALITLGLQAVPMCEVLLERLSLPSSARLDEPGKLQGLLRSFYDALSLVTAARAVGLAGASFEYARAYAEERQAFGKPIGHFQAIAFLLADMATAVDAARWLLWKAAWASERGAATAEAAEAQAQALEAAFFCANSAVQILGGAGYVQDHPVEKWMRDAKTLSLYGLHAQAAHATLAAAELGQELSAAELFPIPSLHPAIS